MIERNHLEWRLDPASDARLPWVTGYDLRPIVICVEGYTSSLAAAALQDLGLALATDVVGGYQAWQAARPAHGASRRAHRRDRAGGFARLRSRSVLGSSAGRCETVPGKAAAAARKPGLRVAAVKSSLTMLPHRPACPAGARAGLGRRDARAASPAVRTMTMTMAMKMSPSVMAASETWLAMAQATIELVNQCAAP